MSASAVSSMCVVVMPLSTSRVLETHRRPLGGDRRRGHAALRLGHECRAARRGPGRAAPRHDAAEAVCAAYVAAIDRQALGEPVIGLVQQVYWDGMDPGQCAPPTFAIPERKAVWCADHGCLDLLWLLYELPEFGVELPFVDVHGDPALRRVCDALLEHIDPAGAHDLVGPYFG